MADIVYKIEYDDETPFQFPKPDVRAIGKPGRIGFATTKDNAEYLAKEGKRVALRRDGNDPFATRGDNAIEEIYPVPDDIKKVKFFAVEKEGKEKGVFHLTCGQIGLHDHKFEAWGEAKREGGKPPIVKPSVPLP